MSTERASIVEKQPRTASSSRLKSRAASSSVLDQVLPDLDNVDSTRALLFKWPFDCDVWKFLFLDFYFLTSYVSSIKPFLVRAFGDLSFTEISLNCSKEDNFPRTLMDHSTFCKLSIKISLNPMGNKCPTIPKMIQLRVRGSVTNFHKRLFAGYLL